MLSSEEQEDAVEEDKSILHCLCSGGSTSLMWLDQGDICSDYIQVGGSEHLSTATIAQRTGLIGPIFLL